MLAVVMAVYRRELQGFHRRPLGWLILLVAALPPLVAGAWLVALSARGGLATRASGQPVTQFLGPNLFLVSTLLVLVPLLTMNLIAEERRRGAWELYATSAAGLEGVVLGKFLAAWTLLLLCLVPWPLVLGLLRVWNGEFQPAASGWPLFGLPLPTGPGLAFDPGLLLGGLVGLCVVGGTLTALGTCCSAWCRHPLLAGLITATLLGLLVAFSLLPTVLENWRIPLEQFAWMRPWAVWSHLSEFSQGTVPLGRCGQHLAVSLALLWLSRVACQDQSAGAA
ncbi:MAG: ABC transporter permease [Planctomycetaceae bacterium]